MRDDRPFCVRAREARDLLGLASELTTDVAVRASSLADVAEARRMSYAPTSGTLDRGRGILPTQLRRSISEARALLLRAEKTLGGE